MAKTINKLPTARSSTIARELLANVFQIPRKFKMVSGEGAEPRFEPVNPKDDYTKDQIILAIGSAMGEIATFAREFDVVRTDNANLVALVNEIHFHAVGCIRPPVLGIAEDIATLREKFNQMRDVLHKNVHHANEKTLEKAKEFLAEVDAWVVDLKSKPAAETEESPKKFKKTYSDEISGPAES